MTEALFCPPGSLRSTEGDDISPDQIADTIMVEFLCANEIDSIDELRQRGGRLRCPLGLCALRLVYKRGILTFPEVSIGLKVIEWRGDMIVGASVQPASCVAVPDWRAAQMKDA